MKNAEVSSKSTLSTYIFIFSACLVLTTSITPILDFEKRDMIPFKKIKLC